MYYFLLTLLTVLYTTTVIYIECSITLPLNNYNNRMYTTRIGIGSNRNDNNQHQYFNVVVDSGSSDLCMYLLYSINIDIVS